MFPKNVKKLPRKSEQWNIPNKPMDDLFSHDGWIVTKNIGGKTKIASCELDVSDPFSETGKNWVTFNSAQCSESQKNSENGHERTYKEPFQKVGSRNNDKRTGYYLIRDLLNFKKLNNVSEAFLADNVPLNKVMVCARITSYEHKDNFYRIILDDGTSSILCMVRVRDDAAYLPESCEKTEVPYCRSKEVSESSVSWVLKKLTLQSKKFAEERCINFNHASLGRPVRIMGYLCEFFGKTFIFTYNFRWVSEEYLVNCLRNLIESYEYKENYMFE